jgi:hypothetical protein
VGTNKPVTVSGLALDNNAGTNYTVTQPTNVTGNITPAGLTVSGVTAVNKLYDGTTVATLSGTAVLVGTISGDDVSLVTSNETAAFADPGVGTGKPVTVIGYFVTGLDSTNYTLAQPAGLTADITTQALKFTKISMVSGSAQLTFTGPFGANYNLLSSSDLTVPVSSWTVVTSGAFGLGPEIVLDNATGSAQRFYIIVLP